MVAANAMKRPLAAQKQATVNDGAKRAKTAHEEVLEQRVEELQGQVQKLKAQVQQYKSSYEKLKASSATGSSMTAAQLDAAVAIMVKLAVKGIESQMKWKPSCKTGRATWAWDGVTTLPVLLRFLKLAPTAKPFKAKRLTVEAFEKYLDTTIQASIRYGCMYLTGKHVNIRFDQESGEIRFSGKYGIPQEDAENEAKVDEYGEPRHSFGYSDAADDDDEDEDEF